MKNIIFWTGLIIATFWDEVLLASIKPEKTKRQQQFFETGETAQYFIGAVEDELVVLLKSLFTLKKFPKSNWLYTTGEYEEVDIYNVNGGAIKGHFTIMIEKRFNPKSTISKPPYYYSYIANGFYFDYEDDLTGKYLFGDNGVDTVYGYKEDILIRIWWKYIMEWNQLELYDKVENFEQIVQIAKTDIELAFILLSGVPNIKKILS